MQYKPQGADEHMRPYKRAIMLASVTLISVTGTAEAKQRLPRDYQAWSRVADCESGGWRVLGTLYPDSLGITRANYVAFGGKPLRPGRVSLRMRVREIRVADRLVAHYHIGIPDQEGCAAW